MQAQSTVSIRAVMTLILTVLSVLWVRADAEDALPCLTNGTAESPGTAESSGTSEAQTLDWNACDSNERLSLALGMLLHDRFHDRYDPIAIDAKLLSFGFERADSAIDLPIDLREAGEILEQTKPPGSYGERYYMLLARALGCDGPRNSVIARRLDEPHDDGAEGAEPKYPVCIVPARNGEGVDANPEYDDDGQVLVRYRREIDGKHQFEALKNDKMPESLTGDEYEEGTFTIRETIEGWQALLQVMEPAVDYEVVIPPSLAYGERGVEGSVKPGEFLRFVMRLMCVERTDEAFEHCVRSQS